MKGKRYNQKSFEIDVDIFLKKHKGKLLDREYKTVNFKYEWECEKGHKWKDTFGHIKEGRWCSLCRKGKGFLLTTQEEFEKQVREIEIERKGELLTRKFKGMSKHYTWKCDKGHEWDSSFSNTKSGKWCPYCAKNTVKPEEAIRKAHETAKRNNGFFLSNDYKGRHGIHKWKCHKGHIWDADYGSVISGSWCGICSGTIRTKEEQLKKAHEVAEKKNGECLSKDYKSIRTKIRWKCNRGHIWDAEFSSVVYSGSWCPVCSNRLAERICRDFFEFLFEEKFPTRKPDWLVNPKTGRKLELDGYSEKLGIAFELQGEQHFKVVKKFKMNDLKLKKQKFRDKLKIDLCKKNKIVLFNFKNDYEYNKFPLLIYKSITGYKPINLKKYLKNNYKDFKLKDWIDNEGFNIYELQEYAKSKKGKCLSKKYIGVKNYYKWECEYKHTWKGTWDNIKQHNNWCPHCNNNIPNYTKRFSVVKSRVKLIGGKIHNKSLSSSKNKLTLECKRGHIWQSRFYHLENGIWCRKCSNIDREEHLQYKKILST